MQSAPELLPGFAYAQPRFAPLSAEEQWQFHLAQLRWLLCAPSLLNPQAGRDYGVHNPAEAASVWHPEVADLAAIQAWLSELAAQTSEQFAPEMQLLNATENAAPLRLGRYAEKLLGLFLRRGPLFTLCAEQLALRAQIADEPAPRTIGELDFILRERSGVLRHWELAVKFYCFQGLNPRAAAPQDFVGPDGADSLARKLSKVFTEQLQRALPAPYSNLPVLRQAYSAGYLFYPLGTAAPACALLNPTHARGAWLSAEQLSELPNAAYLALPRWRWLAPAYSWANDQLLSKAELPARLAAHWHAQNRPSAVMLAQLDARGAECARYFVRCVI